MGKLFGRKRRSRPTSVSTKLPFVRFIGPAVSVAGFLAVIGFVLTGRVDFHSFDLNRMGTDLESSRTLIQPVSLRPLFDKSPDSMTLATFNVHNMSEEKSRDEGILSILASVLSRFDVVALQELEGGNAAPVQRLVERINQEGGQYAFTVSEPVGRGTEICSYAFVWDAARVQLIPRSTYIVQDSADRMRFEPMVASFEARVGTADGRRPFRFTLINVHTLAADVASSAPANEMNVLDDVFVRVRQYDYENTGEEDCILLGDLHCDTGGLQELGLIPNIETIAGDTKTNALRTLTLDHLLIDRAMSREYTGRYGVVDLQQEFGLTQEQVMLISDHLPLWAEFSVYESPQYDAVANGSAAPQY